MSREQREEMRRWARYCAKLKRELRRRRSKIVQVDTLGEVRRALRILRRVERSLVQAERIEKRAGERRKAAFAEIQARAGELAEQG